MCMTWSILGFFSLDKNAPFTILYNHLQEGCFLSSCSISKGMAIKLISSNSHQVWMKLDLKKFNLSYGGVDLNGESKLM